MKLVFAAGCAALVLGACSNIDKREYSGNRPLDPICIACPAAAAASGVVARDGLNGRDGRDGPPGARGPQGERGPQGAQGLVGPTGAAGPSGAPGRAGTDGKPGDDGRDGNDGKRGRDGRDGGEGKAGRDGPPGPKGEAGPAGRDGRDGRDGAPGPKGETGAAGATVNPLVMWMSGAASGAAGSSGTEQGSTGKFILALIAGLGALITALTPIALALLKQYWEDGRLRREARKEAAEGNKRERSVWSDLTKLHLTPWQWLFLAALLIGGTAFFTYLLMQFAAYVLLFILGFILSASVFIVAAAHARRIWQKTDMDQQRLDMRRERHALELTRMSNAGHDDAGGSGGGAKPKFQL